MKHLLNPVWGSLFFIIGLLVLICLPALHWEESYSPAQWTAVMIVCGSVVQVLISMVVAIFKN